MLVTTPGQTGAWDRHLTAAPAAGIGFVPEINFTSTVRITGRKSMYW